MNIWIFWSTSSTDILIVDKLNEIWWVVAKFNHNILTWWVAWYPDIIVREVIKKGGKAIAYLVWLNKEDHSKFHPNIDLDIYSDFVFQDNYTKKYLNYIDNYTRSINLCLDSDIAIIIWWRVWTMYELTILAWLWKDIYVLEKSWWITWKTISDFKKEWHKRTSRIEFFKTWKELENILIKNYLEK